MAALATWSAAPSRADACSPSEPPPTYEPCETLHLYSPRAEVFPVGQSGALRISTRTVTEFGVMGPTEDTFELSEPFVVERETADGWEEVPYTLEDQPNLVVGARHIALTDPQPGRHVVSWARSTCGEPLSESGAGPVIGEFVMSEDVPLPTAAPVLESVEWIGTRDARFSLGIGGECEPIVGRAVLGETEAVVDLTGEWAPWADGASLSVFLDGEVEQGFGDIGTASAEQGRHVSTIKAMCSTLDPDLLDPEHYAPRSGVHDVQIVVRLTGVEGEWWSDVLDYEALCPEDEGDGEGSGVTDLPEVDQGEERDLGCRLGSDRPNPWLVLGLLLPWWRRRWR